MMTAWQVYALDLYPLTVSAIGNGFMRIIGQIGAALSAFFFASDSELEETNKLVFCLIGLTIILIIELIYLRGNKLS